MPLRSSLWKVFENLILVVFVIMLVTTIAQVLFRYVLAISVPWTEEVARWLYVWVIFLGSALALRERIHLKITFAEERLTGRAAALWDFAIRLLVILFLVGILGGSISMMDSVQSVRAGSFPISMSYLYLSLPVSLVLMLVVGLIQVVESLKTLLKPSRERTER